MGHVNGKVKNYWRAFTNINVVLDDLLLIRVETCSTVHRKGNHFCASEKQIISRFGQLHLELREPCAAVVAAARVSEIVSLVLVLR